MSDPVNHPAHYTFGKFEVIDVLEDFFSTDPLLWQVGNISPAPGAKAAPLRIWKKPHGICGAGLKKKKLLVPSRNE